MQRREFMMLVGGGAAAWPIAARAQPAMPVIGFLNGGSGSAEAMSTTLSDFGKSLSEMGFVEGRNVSIEYRFAQNEFDRLPAMAADLVRRQVSVIVAASSTPGGAGRQSRDLDNSYRLQRRAPTQSAPASSRASIGRVAMSLVLVP
jgi:hypothetical protein